MVRGKGGEVWWVVDESCVGWKKEGDWNGGEGAWGGKEVMKGEG